MMQLIAPITALLAGVALLLLGSGLLSTLLAVRGSSEGFSDTTLGLVMSGYFVGFFLGTFLAPRLIQRIGHIRAFAFFAAACACATLLHGLWLSPWGWGLLRAVTGAALVGLYTVIESWLNAQTPREHRGQVFAVYMVVNLGALALGQQLLRLGSPLSFTLFAVVALAICAAMLPVTWTRLAQPQLQPSPHLRLGYLYRRVPTAVAGALLSGLAMGAFWGLAPVFAARSGMDNGQIAGFMTTAILGGAALQLPLGRLSDRYDRRAVLGAVCALAAVVALAGLLLPPLPSRGLLALIFIYGGLAFAVYPISIAHLTDHLDNDQLLQGSSSALLLHGIGAALSPALAGILMDRFDASALFGWFAATQAALALYVGWRYGVRRRHSTHPEPFMPMLRTTPAVLQLLPQQEISAEHASASRHDPGTPS